MSDERETIPQLDSAPSSSVSPVCTECGTTVTWVQSGPIPGRAAPLMTAVCSVNPEHMKYPKAVKREFNDMALYRKFVAGYSVRGIADEFGVPYSEIEIRLRAIMVGMSIRTQEDEIDDE